MTIVITEEKIITDINTSLDAIRYTNIIISDGSVHYRLGVGGLPLIGDLQFILNARETELWKIAQGKNNQLSTHQVRHILYKSPKAGGWNSDDFQEAVFEKDDGDSTKWDILKARRATIRAEWQN